MVINPVTIKNLSEVNEINENDKFIVFRKNESGQYESYEMEIPVLDNLLVTRDILPKIKENIFKLNEKYTKLITVLNEKFIKSKDAAKLFSTKAELKDAEDKLLSKDAFDNAIAEKLADMSQINYVRSYIFSNGAGKKFRIMSVGSNVPYTSTANPWSIKENLSNKARANGAE